MILLGAGFGGGTERHDVKDYVVACSQLLNMCFIQYKILHCIYYTRIFISKLMHLIVVDHHLLTCSPCSGPVFVI